MFTRPLADLCRPRRPASKQKVLDRFLHQYLFTHAPITNIEEEEPGRGALATDLGIGGLQ